MTMKSKSNGNLSEERVSETKKEKGHKEREREFLMQCCHSTLSVFFLPYGSITISLIHGYGLAVSASKIMFA